MALGGEKLMGFKAEKPHREEILWPWVLHHVGVRKTDPRNSPHDSQSAAGTPTATCTVQRIIN